MRERVDERQGEKQMKGGQPVYLHRNVSFYSLDDLVSGFLIFRSGIARKRFQISRGCSYICFARARARVYNTLWSNVNTEVRGAEVQLVSRTDLSRDYRGAHAYCDATM